MMEDVVPVLIVALATLGGVTVTAKFMSDRLEIFSRQMDILKDKMDAQHELNLHILNHVLNSMWADIRLTKFNTSCLLHPGDSDPGDDISDNGENSPEGISTDIPDGIDDSPDPKTNEKGEIVRVVYSQKLRKHRCQYYKGVTFWSEGNITQDDLKELSDQYARSFFTRLAGTLHPYVLLENGKRITVTVDLDNISSTRENNVEKQ